MILLGGGGDVPSDFSMVVLMMGGMNSPLAGAPDSMVALVVTTLA